MAKRRKTKRQKVISDSRHLVDTTRLSQSQEAASQELPSQTYTFEVTQTTTKLKPTQIVSVSDYQYLLHDIRKIALVTILITITELGIFWTSNGF